MIRLQHHVRRPRPRVKLTRREVFARDRHTCQYCGRAGARPDARPHRAAPPRRRAHLGQPRRGVQGLQPPQGRQDARGGAHAPAARARSSRAATSTRCSPRISPTSATRPGGLPVPRPQLTRRRAASRRPPAPIVRARLDPVAIRSRAHGRLWAHGHAGVRRRRLAPRRAPRPRPPRTGTSPPTPGPTGCWRSSRAPSTRTGSGRWRSARATTSTR